ncbi:protein N-terminal asparagine amidohydrolase [Sesamum angolense]|uniref:Protein N-terminal asparagine amidohydrolase n=1 Tax=Sesamum angolense TaxID=2727404 RepID=A0AAE2C6L7_9LAMI|nr:protein N-terminal asparagine amidohydrolase [Sesamum angolense]
MRQSEAQTLSRGAPPPDKNYSIITMIYLGGEPFAPDDSSEGIDTLIALMEHPVLVSASNSFKSMAEMRVSVSENSSSVGPEISKCVYIFQREFATVDPALVDLVGTDEATTCVGIAIRNCKTGMISVAHMDSPNVVDTGLSQMLSLVADHESDALLDVHLIGGFDDISSQVWPYSPVMHLIYQRKEKFQIQTLHVLGHNTKWDSEGIAYPIFHGFVMETSTGSITPASFDGTSRCPDEIVRRIRVTAAFEDPSWTGKLLDTYDTRTDHFVIAPCVWTIRQKHIALTLQNLSDTEILLACSSSPYAEVPDFVDNEKRLMCLEEVGLLDQTPKLERNFSFKAAPYVSEDCRRDLGQTVNKMKLSIALMDFVMQFETSYIKLNLLKTSWDRYPCKEDANDLRIDERHK